MQVDLRHHLERLRQIGLLAGLQILDRALEHLAVEAEADLLDFAALVLAQHLAGAADLEIVHGQEKPSRVPPSWDRLEPLWAAGGALAWAGQQIGVGLVVGAPDRPRSWCSCGPGRSGRRG